MVGFPAAGSDRCFQTAGAMEPYPQRPRPAPSGLASARSTVHEPVPASLPLVRLFLLHRHATLVVDLGKASDGPRSATGGEAAGSDLRR
jgi:hypothetical protein